MTDAALHADPNVFLYLTTIGRKSGRPHEIEIWYVAHGGRYYLMSEYPDRADWVRNIRHNPAVRFHIGRAVDAPTTEGTSRAVDAFIEPELAAAVAGLMQAKYGWNDGMIVELTPERSL